MAAFLRKKTKQDPMSKVLPPVTISSPISPPPLFARFATTAQNNTTNAASQRIVSSPMALASRKESQKGGAGRATTTSLAAGSREAEAARRRVLEQAQASQPSVNGTVYASSSSTSRYPQAQSSRPISHLGPDKPLPSPVAIQPPQSPVNRRTPAGYGQGPPPTFQTQNQGVRSRASLDMRDLENKPLPRAGSARAYWQDPKPPSTNYEFTPKPPPKRNGSVSTAAAPPIGSNPTGKMQPIPPAAFGQQRPPTADDESFAGQTLPPHLSNGPVSRKDFPPDSVNRIGGGSSNRMSMVGSQQTRPQGTPMSDRVLDLPPDAALFQEYSDTITIPSAPSSLNSRRPPPSSTLKSTEQVPGANQPSSSIHTETDRNPLQPQPSIPQFDRNRPPRTASPPLPPPLPAMGVTTSHVVVSDLLPSSYKDFSPPRVQTNTNVPNSAYNNANNGNQYQPQQQFPNRANSRSTSPPLPPGAALPANFHPFQVRSQDAPPPPRSRPLPSVHQHLQKQRPFPDPHPHVAQPPPLQPAEVSLRKSLSFQATIAPLKGKPRIFAAMEAQENELEKVPDIQQPPPPQPQLVPQHQRQHQRQDQQQPAPHHVITKRPPPNQQIQHQPHHRLLPSVELEFSTPMSRFDPLPNEFSNGNAFEADLRSSSTYKTPPTHQRPLPEQAPPHQSEAALNASRPNSSRSVPHQDEPRQQLLSPQSTPRSRKLSKPRTQPDSSSLHTHPNASSTTLPGTPESYNKVHQHGGHRAITKSHPSTPPSLEPVVQLDEDTIRNAGIPLDDDPFARVEGVTMLKPTTPPPAKEGSIKRQRAKGSLKGVSSDNVAEDLVNGSRDDVAQVAEPQKQNGAPTPLTPVSPEDYRQWRKERKHRKSGTVPPPPVVDMVVQNIPPRDPFTLAMFVSDPQLLSSLLAFLTFYDWCVLSAVSKEIRVLLVRTPVLREAVLEAYLKTVGYNRWMWDDQEPLSLSLQDLSDYMRGVSTPTHEYARVAAMHVHSLKIHPNHRDPSLAETVRSLTASTRAYTRVVLRLRAQAEKEAAIHAATTTSSHPPPSSIGKAAGSYSPARGATPSRVSSRAPSPTTSMYSYTQHNSSHPHPPGSIQQTSSQTSLTFRSPLFRLRRAPLLRVFVPSPEGDWLSDKSVVECEAECKRAGVMHLMRSGDVVWDVAVGDEGNVGRLVWDGSYLLDLDYTYSTIGDLPKYLPTLTFPPSYFHRVIRTGANATNPIVHIDISPWGEEIALNLQLLQDRVRTETPQGAYHNVVRWVHRSSFSIRAPRSPPRYNNSARPSNGRIPIPDSNNLFVDHGWYGTVVVETEGTNEALADLQDRCGPGAFPPRSRAVSGHITQAQIENRKVFRILRERSRPGEIWIKAVGVKERLL